MKAVTTVVILILLIFYYNLNKKQHVIFNKCLVEVVESSKNPILKEFFKKGHFSFQSLPNDYRNNATFLREQLSAIDFYKQKIANCFLKNNSNKKNYVILFTTGECSPTLWRLKEIDNDIDLFKIFKSSNNTIRYLKGREKLTKESLFFSNVSYYAFFSKENCINHNVFKRHENNNQIKGFLEKNILTTSFNVLIKEGQYYHLIYNNSVQLHNNIDIQNSSHSYVKLKKKDLINFYPLKLLFDKKILQ